MDKKYKFIIEANHSYYINGNKMRLKNIFSLTLLGFFFLVVSCKQSAEDSSASIDSAIAKNFTLDSLTEKKQLSLEEFKGKGVVLNFWATWCGPCREEMPLFEETWSKYNDENVVFLGINVMDDKSNAQEFIDSIGVTYPNLYDPEGDVSRKYNVVALPATFFINKDGNLVAKNYGSFQGSRGKEVLNRSVEEIAK